MHPQQWYSHSCDGDPHYQYHHHNHRHYHHHHRPQRQYYPHHDDGHPPKRTMQRWYDRPQPSSLYHYYHVEYDEILSFQ